MSEILATLMKQALDRWETRTGLALAVVAVVVSLIVTFAGIDLAAVSAWEWIVVGLAALVVFLYWWSTRIKPVPRGRVGFAIAFIGEDGAEAKALQADFVDCLKALVAGSGLKQRLEFRNLGPRVAKNVFDDSTNATRAMLRANVHFLLVGRVRIRVQNGERVGVVDLIAAVRHASLPGQVKKQLGEEVGQIVPTRIVVPEGQFVVAEVAAGHVEAVARYVIGIAAAVSNDLSYAESILGDAEQRVKELLKTSQGIPLSALMSRIQALLVDVMGQRLINASARFAASRDRSDLKEPERLALRIREREPTHYNATLTIGMCEFLMRQNTAAALLEINKCRGVADATWLYSRAFLEAYDGDLEAAYRTYREAFESALADLSVLSQVEQFIQSVLEQEPQRYWLYFCLGLINYRAKGDMLAARSDLSAFLEQADTTRFKVQIQAARKWLREIEARPAAGVVAEM